MRYMQTEAIDAQFAHWAEGGGNSLIEMATGIGKSVVNAGITRRLLREYPDIRVLSVTHVKELIEQNCKAMLKLWPQAPVGIYSASVGRRDVRAQVTFAGIQSIYDKSDILGAFDLIAIDEAHLVPRKTDTMYGRFLEANAAKTDHRLTGLSATIYRMDSGRLDRGEGAMFEKVVYSYGIARGIEDGYLTPLISPATLSEIDTTGLRSRNGDYAPGELERAALKGDNIERACDETIEFGRNRRAWLVFTTGVKHAHRVADYLNARGIKAAVITGDTPRAERASLISLFKAGLLRALISVGVLTTGFDAPTVDLIGNQRPTDSAGLYVQIGGRGTRLIDPSIGNLPTAAERRAAIASSIKPNCLFLDFGGVIRKHGPLDDIRVKEKAEKEPRTEEIEPRRKVCPECGAEVPLATVQCLQCGFAFRNGDRGENIDGEAEAIATILKSDAKPIIRKVTGWSFHRHEKPGAPVSLRIDYQCGMKVQSEWLCFGHGDIARGRAIGAWRQLCPLGRVRSYYPDSVNAAWERLDELDMPHKIEVKQEGRYFKVAKRIYERETEAA